MHIYLSVGETTIRFVSKTPYLIEQTSVAPDVTGSGVLLVRNGLWSRPLNWYQSTFRYVVLLIGEVT